MTKVAIIYHSGYGHTEVVARAVAAGAESVPGTEVFLVKVDEFAERGAELDNADAIIFGCPTYMGSASAPMKTFMDATSKRWMEGIWKDKLAAGFTNSGSWHGDKQTTLIQLITFASQHGMVWVGLGMMPGANTSKSSHEEMNRVGASLGAMTQSNIDQGPDIAPPLHDQATGKALGKRVAESAHRWVRGK